MATADEDAAELEMLRRANPGYKPPGSSLPPAVQSTVGTAKEALTPTTPSYAAVDSASQYGMHSGILGTLGREAVIAGNQAGVGAIGLPMSALNLLWRAGGGEPPAWTRAQGPGSYGEGLTIPGFNPMTSFERELSAGARQAGSALPFVATGAMGPVALGINALGGFGGQTLTEAGYPTAGAITQLVTGLGSGFGSASRMPGANPPPMWTNVGGGMTAAERTAATEKSILDILAWEPMTSRLPLGLGVIPNKMIIGRNFAAASPSGATTAARQILGGAAMGGAIGTSSAVENAPPAISYSAPPSFAPSGANQ